MAETLIGPLAELLVGSETRPRVKSGATDAKPVVCSPQLALLLGLPRFAAASSALPNSRGQGCLPVSLDIWLAIGLLIRRLQLKPSRCTQFLT